MYGFTRSPYHPNDATYMPFTYARTRHPHVLPTRRRSLINDDSAALLHHCLDTRSTCPRLYARSAAARLRACALVSRARRMFTNYDRIRSRDERRNGSFFFNFFSVFEKKIFSSISYLLTSFDIFKYVIPHCDCN